MNGCFAIQWLPYGLPEEGSNNPSFARQQSSFITMYPNLDALLFAIPLYGPLFWQVVPRHQHASRWRLLRPP